MSLCFPVIFRMTSVINQQCVWIELSLFLFYCSYFEGGFLSVCLPSECLCLTSICPHTMIFHYLFWQELFFLFLDHTASYALLSHLFIKDELIAQQMVPICFSIFLAIYTHLKLLPLQIDKVHQFGWLYIPQPVPMKSTLTFLIVPGRLIQAK